MAYARHTGGGDDLGFKCGRREEDSTSRSCRKTSTLQTDKLLDAAELAEISALLKMSVF